MKIIFWQNIISPHQVDFLKELSSRYEIILIVGEILDAERQQDGWEIPHYDYLKIIISPEINLLDQYFKDPEDIHVFSGIAAYRTVYAGFKKAISYSAKIGILSEPIHLKGIKGFLKLLRGNYQRLKYGNKIGFIAATGDLGTRTYQKFGYKATKILQWGYFVNSTYNQISEKNNNLIFVGNLNYNKQIGPLLNLYLENEFSFDRFEIVGSGPLEDEIRSKTKGNKKIKLYGRLTNKEALKILAQSKLLVLPSLEDGWGVVINEALLGGTPVIISDNVGAKILVENSDRGAVFKAGDYEQLKKLLQIWTTKNYEQKDYLKIQNWAKEKITPVLAADYFSKIICYSFQSQNAKEKPIAPWLK